MVSDHGMTELKVPCRSDPGKVVTVVLTVIVIVIVTVTASVPVTLTVTVTVTGKPLACF